MVEVGAADTAVGFTTAATSGESGGAGVGQRPIRSG